MTVAEVTRTTPGSSLPDARPLLRPPAPLQLSAADLDPDTMVAVSTAQAMRYGDRIALTFKDAQERWCPVSWREQHESAVAFAAGLVHAGIAKGDRLAVLSENRLEWLHCDFGAQLAGVIGVPIYSSSTADMVAQILVDSEATAVVCSTPVQAAKVNAIRDRATALRLCALMEGTADGFTTLQQLADGATPEDVHTVAQRARTITRDDLVTIIYTSGTTGVPKGVMLTHDNVVQSCRAVIDRVPISDDDVGISFLPWAHVYERVQGIFAGMMAGVTAAIARDVSDIGGDVRAVRPTLMNGVPRIWEKMQEAIIAKVREAGGRRTAIGLKALDDATNHARLRRAGQPIPVALRLRMPLWERLVLTKVREGLGGRMRVFSSGGGPIGLHTLEFFDGLGIAITEGYGLTETSGGVAANDPAHPRFGTVGPATRGHQIRIADDGEIMVKGPGVMRGYFRNETATAEVLDESGWFATGDIGELDPDGCLRITDRKKDLIVTAGGKNIAPQPIEAAIAHDPLVVRACVIGDGCKYLVALIVPDFDNLHDWARDQGVTTRSDAELVANPRVVSLYAAIAERTSANLARYETIKRVAVLPRDFDPDQGEVTPTLKVKRRVVAEHFGDLIESLYTTPGPVQP